MAFASGSVSLQRFSIDGQMPAEVDDTLVAALNAQAFGHAPPQSDDTQIGWIGPRHLFDTEITGDAIACGPFAHLAVRIDQLKPPANIVRAYVHLEEETALQDSGRAFLNRAEQRRARAAAQDRADKEARAGSFRRRSLCPMLIDLEHGDVYLGTLGATAADKVMQLFYDTFGRGLEPIDAERLASRILERARRARVLESLTPFTLVKPPDHAADLPANVPGSDLNFLGKEFLTWLWYQTDRDDSALAVRGGDALTLMIDRTMRLKCDFGLTGSDVITADSPTLLPEARAALRVGKQLTRAGLVIGAPGGEFRFTLDGQRLAVSGLALPEEDGEPDARARLEQRFERISDVVHLIDALFELFLLERTGRTWDQTLRAMSEWATGKSRRRRLRVTSA
jgi:recombination associated protein RdgC